MEFAFILKKVITMFIMPLPLGMILFLLGLLFLFRGRQTKAKLFLILSFLWLTLISYEPLTNYLLYKHEMRYPTLKQAPQNIDYIYVLGNGHHTDDAHPITSQVNSISSVRLNEAIRLYHQLKHKPTIILSGYSGLFDPTPGAVMQKRLALALGIKEEHLHIEPTPKDTQEEAKAAKRVIGDRPFILVTSASHMYRAMQFFLHENLSAIPAPTNHQAHIKYPNYAGIFSPYALRQATILWHEYIGILWQKLKGV